MVENVIDNPIELLIFFLIFLAGIKLLFGFANWMEGRPIKEKKSKAKDESTKTEKVEKVEEIKKEEKPVSIEVKKDVEVNNNSNYLYDRFVVTPTIDDNIAQKKKCENFLSDDEASKIRNRDIKITVKPVEDISIDRKKDKLYKKIEQMASENLEAKEKMLKEFDELPKSMKLLLIENIMQKM